MGERALNIDTLVYHVNRMNPGDEDIETVKSWVTLTVGTIGDLGYEIRPRRERGLRWRGSHRTLEECMETIDTLGARMQELLEQGLLPTIAPINEIAEGCLSAYWAAMEATPLLKQLPRGPERDELKQRLVAAGAYLSAVFKMIEDE